MTGPPSDSPLPPFPTAALMISGGLMLVGGLFVAFFASGDDPVVVPLLVAVVGAVLLTGGMVRDAVERRP